jgi:acyl-CoA thioesterase-1
VRAAKGERARVLLVGMRLPPNYGPQYTAAFHDAFADIARAERIPLVPFLFEGMADRRELFQEDNLHPTAAAQEMLLDNVWKQLRPLLRAKPADAALR